MSPLESGMAIAALVLAGTGLWCAGALLVLKQGDQELVSVQTKAVQIEFGRAMAGILVLLAVFWFSLSYFELVYGHSRDACTQAAPNDALGEDEPGSMKVDLSED